ncbi:toll-like receptor 5 [Mercenaria mercenaria]|uniref:toll-like receptor 5 n=1 Tax=Mercenaria mercenaria TaxID=6596 RepID=UPI00234F41AC|nr:toll-like receptor 5 [Mercenaria mercenaria]
MPSVYTTFLFTVSLASALRRSCVVEDKDTVKCNYFPNSISDEISRVRVVDFIGPNESMVIDSTDFNAEGWKNVKYLEISNSLSYSNLKLKAKTFSDLKRLVELQLHLDHFHLDSDTFVGLKSVKSLDFSDCFRVSFGTLLQSLNGTDKLPSLTRLTMSRLNEYHTPNTIGESFGQILQQKRLTYLDMSNTGITAFHFVIFKYLRHLKLFNISGSTVGETFTDNFDFSDLKNIVFDLSEVILPQRMRPPPGKLVISNRVVKNTSVHAVGFVLFKEAKIVNLSSIIPTRASIWVYNTTIVIDKPIQVLVQRIITKGNNLKYLDLRVDHFCKNCIVSSLEEIDFSYNGLQFINPLLANFAPNIKILNLSFNQLFKMAKNNDSLFKTSLNSLSHLQYISLSGNNLNTVPMKMFGSNVDLEIIDLSSNKLRQVTFLLKHLENLQVLDLRNNFIHILDETSISLLDSIYHIPRHNGSYSAVYLKGNNMSCSTCDAKTFIKWLLDTNIVNITSQNLTCSNEDGKQITIEQSTLDLLQDLCYFELCNVVICLSVTVLSVLTAFGSVKACKKWHRGKVIKRLQDGHGKYKYAALLVYHHDDNTFVEDYVAGPLETEIKNVKNITRNLIAKSEDVCPGHNFISELNEVINTTPVVIAIVSRNVFDDAIFSVVIEGARDNGKPIIFFLKIEPSGLDREKLTPGVRQLLKIKPKFVWRQKNEEYIMESTWQNICTTILDYA